MESGFIEQTVFGGDGLLKESDGRVVFIPCTLPHEQVTYEITEAKRSFARASLCQIIKSHPQRVAPPCPHYQICQGCQLQHASVELQREMKRSWLQDLLKRLGSTEINAPDLTPCKPWNYRRSVEWLWQDGSLGYSSAFGQFIPIKTCLLFEGSEEYLNIMAHLLHDLSLSSARIRLLRSPQEMKLPIAGLDTPIILNPALLNPIWERYKNKLGGLIFHQGKKIYATFGEPFSEGDVLGLPIRWHGLSFVQNHIKGSLAFYAWIEEQLKNNYDETQPDLIDLYCGVGITSLLAARAGYHVHGFEINPLAIACARHNATHHAWKERVHFYASNLRKFKNTSLVHVKHWIVNPPKSGIDEGAMRALMGPSTRNIIYLSCNPATLARDIKIMRGSGFTIKKLHAFDCFAQTTHFETVVYLQRNA